MTTTTTTTTTMTPSPTKKDYLVENRVSSLECESRTCAKPAFTAKLPFSASVLPLILSLFVFPPRVSSQMSWIGARKCGFSFSCFFPFFFRFAKGATTPGQKKCRRRLCRNDSIIKTTTKTRNTNNDGTLTYCVCKKTIAQRYYQPTYV